LDGEQVIVYGGIGNISDIIKSEDSLYTLNINTFEWSIPKVSGNIPNSRYMHKANVIGNYMVVTFGKYIIIDFILNFVINDNLIFIILSLI
jgi:hypothetical protein